MIAEAYFGCEPTSQCIATPFALALHAARMIGAVIGAEHQGFAREIARSGEQVEVFAIHFGVGQHIGYGSPLGLGHT